MNPCFESLFCPKFSQNLQYNIYNIKVIKLITGCEKYQSWTLLPFFTIARISPHVKQVHQEQNKSWYTIVLWSHSQKYFAAVKVVIIIIFADVHY